MTLLKIQCGRAIVINLISYVERSYGTRSALINLFLPSGFSAMAVFMYSFIAYTPEHRCTIPECDLDDNYSDGGGGFNFLNFTHPSGTEDEASCYHYK